MVNLLVTRLASFLLMLSIQFTSITAQTYFSVGVGWDNAILEQGRDFELREGALYLTEEMSNSSNYFIQGTIEQQLSSSSFLALTGFYMGRKEGAANWFASFFPADQICFNIWGVRATYRRELFDALYLGSGIGASFYHTQVSYRSNKRPVLTIYPNNTSFDLPFLIGYQYNQFIIEGYYQLGLGYQKDYGELVEPLRSFGVSINYLFKLSESNKRISPRF